MVVRDGWRAALKRWASKTHTSQHKIQKNEAKKTIIAAAPANENTERSRQADIAPNPAKKNEQNKLHQKGYASRAG